MRRARHLARHLAVALLLAAALAACAPGRAVQSLDLLTDVAGGTHADAREFGPVPTDWVDGDGHRRAGDLYRPFPEAARAGIVLVPGATPRGRRDPRLAAFARELAAAGFAVLVPALPGIRDLRVDADHARPIAAAVRHLTGPEPWDGGPPETVGLVAISYAAGPATLAALRPEVRGRVGYLLLVGPYHDVEGALTYVTTGAYRRAPGADWRRGRPNPRGKWVFVAGNADRLQAPGDAALLREIANRKLDDPDATVADLTADLGPAGRAVLALATNADPERVPALLDALPEEVAAEIAALDISRRDLRALPGPVLLVHGRDDPVIPYTESLRFAEALPEGRAELYLVDGLLHADLEAVGLGDGLRLWRLAYRVLTLRERAAAPAAEPAQDGQEQEGKTRP